MPLSMFNSYSVIPSSHPSSPMKSIWENLPPSIDSVDLLSFNGPDFSHTLSSPTSSNDSSDTIDDQDDNLPVLRRKCRFQMPEGNCGDDAGFDVNLQGKGTINARNFYYIRQGFYFSLGISFADNLHNDLSHLFVRITPSWSVHRADASTIIYCCSKHLKNSQAVSKLEKYSMLRMGPGILGAYDIDESTDRLTILVPMCTKDRTAPFWINLKSECFSTCGASQKKSHHLITVTLEHIRQRQKTVVGRKIFPVKFSSSPYRDLRNRNKTAVDLSNGGLTLKRFEAKNCPLHNRVSPVKSLCGDFVPSAEASAQVTLLPIKNKYVERVKSFLKHLQDQEGEQGSVCSYETDLRSIEQNGIPLCAEYQHDLFDLESSFGRAETQGVPHSCVPTPNAAPVGTAPGSGLPGAIPPEDARADDDIWEELFTDREPIPPAVSLNDVEPSFLQNHELSYFTLLPPNASLPPCATLVGQSSIH